ncbi:T6SS component TssK [Citrifermentans bremense]|uniref:T6SS component TssK n=1 Tax=Citrifermentans bremense TaxID=60035 RepID=A0A6S6M416_9BACT|nr:type VI secretion system baseplate subunit TssK [Citrifermentans bremense]BCG46404.1 T6SS component TssK [Citrifermentans bremense]
MAIERPVFWHQGLFLHPQHFQLSERALQSQLAPYQFALMPDFWGVQRMEIRCLNGGITSLKITGAFLFPDGTYAVVQENARVESRPVLEEALRGKDACTVYLGLKKWSPAGHNVTTLLTGEPLSQVATRFVVEADAAPCADLHAGGTQAEVRQMSLALKLFWESELEALGDYLLIPVGRLVQQGQTAALSGDFIPPCITVAGSSALFDLLQEIREQLASRCRWLEGYKKERGIQSAEFGSKDLVFLLALRTVSRHLARLSHWIQAREVHPWQVYGLLGELAAELACFSETVGSFGEPAALGAVMPQYRHRDLAATFRQGRDLILTLLNEVTAGPEYALTLTFDGTWFACTLKPSHFEGHSRFYLVLNTDEDPKLVLSSVATAAKLSARERLPLLISQALPGIALEHLVDPPRELPHRSCSLFFSIDSRCEQWEQVRKYSNIALSWDQAPADLQVQLMIVARS